MLKKIRSHLENFMKQMKLHIGTLYYAAKDNRTPLLPKIFAIIVVGYALSPIDLIPDFIPILGYLDDVILLPLGIALAIKLIPVDIRQSSKASAEKYFDRHRDHHLISAAVILLIWLLVLVWIIQLFI